MKNAVPMDRSQATDYQLQIEDQGSDNDVI
jgi:hypothetical protein